MRKSGRKFKSGTRRRNLSGLVSFHMFTSILISGMVVAVYVLNTARNTHLESDCICPVDIRVIWMNEDAFWLFRAESFVLGRIGTVLCRVLTAEERFVDLVRAVKTTGQTFWRLK